MLKCSWEHFNSSSEYKILSCDPTTYSLLIIMVFLFPSKISESFRAFGGGGLDSFSQIIQQDKILWISIIFHPYLFLRTGFYPFKFDFFFWEKYSDGWEQLKIISRNSPKFSLFVNHELLFFWEMSLCIKDKKNSRSKLKFSITFFFFSLFAWLHLF